MFLSWSPPWQDKVTSELRVTCSAQGRNGTCNKHTGSTTRFWPSYGRPNHNLRKSRLLSLILNRKIVPREQATLPILETVRGSGHYPWEPWVFPAPVRIYKLFLQITNNSPTSAYFSAPLSFTLLKKSIMYFISTSPAFLLNSFLSLLSYHSIETWLPMVTYEHSKSHGQFSVFILICPSSCPDKVGHSLLFRNTFFPLTCMIHIVSGCSFSTWKIV